MVEQIHGKNPQGCVAVEGSEHDDGYRDGVSCGRRHHLKVEVANLINVAAPGSVRRMEFSRTLKLSDEARAKSMSAEMLIATEALS